MKKIERLIITSLLTLILVCSPYSPATAIEYQKSQSVEAYIAHIKTCFDTKDWKSAKILLDEALSIYPDESELNLWAGTYYIQQKELDNARYFLIKATQQNPDNLKAKLQLITLEEELGNLSSAICYTNELLEQYPYDRALWKRKIGLYRKAEDHKEADRLLKRLHFIYPNDTSVTQDYVNRMEENYLRERKNRQLDDAIQSLKELLKYKKEEPTYYLDLCNLLLQQGQSEEAIAILTAGIEILPGNITLIKKKAEIMTEKGNGLDAYGLTQNSMIHNDSLKNLRIQVLNESARRESWKDPYLLYGKIYGEQKSLEALDYLIRISFSRGYDEDALYYLTEASKKYGNTPDILYKKYRVYKRIGESQAAMRTLEKLVQAAPKDEDIQLELILAKLQVIDKQMGLGRYEEALTEIQSISKLSCDEDIKQAIINKQLECYSRINRPAQVIYIIDSIRTAKADGKLYIVQRAVALRNMERFDEALSELEQQEEPNTETYESIATRYLQTLMENGATKHAYATCKRWLNNIHNSNTALKYAIQNASELNLYEEEKQYVKTGRELYTDDIYFVQKAASILYREQRYRDGLKLIESYLDSLSGNQILKNTYAAHAELRAEELLKEKKTEEAILLLEKAVKLDNSNQSLLYTMGTAYEQAGDYKTAYQIFSRYNPPVKQLPEYKRKLMTVQRQSYHNRFAAELLAGWYSNGETANSIQSVSYTRMEKKNTYTGTVNFTSHITSTGTANGEETTDSKSGVQFKGNWGHIFNEKWSSQLELAVANQFFPTWSGQIGLYHYFPKDIEVGGTLGYRRNYTTYGTTEDTHSAASSNMFSLKLSTTLYKEMWRISLNCDSYLLNNNAYFNINSQIRFYPLNDYETHLSALLGVGTAPEASYLDKMMPGSFDKLNVTFGLGGAYMLSKNLSLGMIASYYRFYQQTASLQADSSQPATNYKDLYNIYAQLTFSF